MEGRSILNEELDTIEGVKNAVKIPVSVKLSPFYTNPLYTVKEMDKKGANGFVLFNKLFQPDINIEMEEMTFPYNLSTEHESRLPLRYVGMLYDNVEADLCANRGIFTGEDVIKMILAGVQTRSFANYQNARRHGNLDGQQAIQRPERIPWTHEQKEYQRPICLSQSTICGHSDEIETDFQELPHIIVVPYFTKSHC